MKVKHKEEIPKTSLEVEEGGEVQPEVEDVGEEHLSTPMIMRADASESPSERSHILPSFAALRSTSSSCHYSRLKSAKAT